MHMMGGMALFLYGMTLTKNGLQLFAGDRLRSIVHNLTENRLMGLGVGALVTTIIQSSTATTVMLVGFASAGLVTLRQSMGVILGADIGTTVTVQIISLKLTDYALWLIVIGFLPMLLAKKKRLKYLGEVVLGFGFIFYGMGLMVDAASPIKGNPLTLQALDLFASKPFWGLLVSAIITFLVHSSAATIGLVLSLALSGTMSLEAALPMVLGANIGTCGTAVLSSLGAGVVGRRVAWAHMAFKVLGVGIVFLFLGLFAEVVRNFTDFLSVLMGSSESTVVRQIAWAHTLFNIGISFSFLPFVPISARLLERIIPDDQKGEDAFRPKYLDKSALETPSLAFGNAMREMLRMVDIVQEMLDKTLKVFQTNSKDLIEEVEAQDDLVDLLDHEIKLYLTQLSRKELSGEQSAMELQLITLTTNLEHIGDVIDKNLMELARKKQRLALVFSKDGWSEIKDFHKKVSENFRLAVACYTNRDVDLAHTVIRHKKRLTEFEIELKEAHIERLHQGLKESYETSSLHLEILSNLRRINSYVTGFAYTVLEAPPHRVDQE